jgi:cytoskeletal protein RodZ
MEPQQNGKKREIIAALAVLIVIVAIVAGTSIASKKKTDSDTQTVSTTKSTTSDSSATDTSTEDSSNTSDSSTSSSSGYTDGDYSATGSYESPGGSESITVNVTLKDGVVTATSAKSGATDPEAQEYQDDFISGYKQLVVGKSVDSISLSRVSGSSLTSQGFNSALSKIKSAAKSA